MVHGRGQRQFNQEADALRLGLDLGMCLIDTAEMYGDGGAEEVVAEAIDGSRGEVFLVSKVLPSNASRKGTSLACERSLKRLEMRNDRPLSPALARWISRLRKRSPDSRNSSRPAKSATGASAISIRTIWRSCRISTAANAVATNQVLYNLTRRGVEFDLLPWCQAHKIPIMAYSPIEQGRMFDHPALTRIAKECGATPAAWH